MTQNLHGVVVTDINDAVLVSSLLQGGLEKLLDDCTTLELEAAKRQGSEITRCSQADRYGVSFSIVPNMCKLVVSVLLAGRTHILFVSLDREGPSREEERHPWQGPQRELHIQVCDNHAGPLLLDLALSVLGSIGLTYTLPLDPSVPSPASRHPYPLRLHDMLGTKLLQPSVFDALAFSKLRGRGPFKDAGLFRDIFDMTGEEFNNSLAHITVSTRWTALYNKVSAAGAFAKLLPYWPTSLQDLNAD